MFMLSAILAAGLAVQATPVAAASIPGATMPVAVATIPEPSQVLVIPDELRNEFRARVVDTTNIPEQRLRRMIAFMLGKDGLGLQYKSDATNTVAESYRTRQVNCLSFTLMAVALAREAGMKAQGQQIDRVMAWNLVGDVVMQSLHANAVVTLKDRNLMVKDGRDFVIDIASSGLYNTQDFIIHDYKVDDQHLLASFYGNRAMELLAKGRLADSQSWLGKAMALSPDDALLWNNAGVLSQRAGDVAAAERWFLRAAKQNPGQTSVLYNLVALYQARGDTTRATFWREHADRILRDDPYYQFSLGERNAQSGEYQDAVRYYRRAISLDGGERLFRFGLARAYMQLGKLDEAESAMIAAYQLSEGSDRTRFQAKLDALRGMRR
jgi:Flp pilus assembly protein TadD